MSLKIKQVSSKVKKAVSTKLKKSHSISDVFSKIPERKVDEEPPYVWDPKAKKQKDKIIEKHEEELEYCEHDSRYELRKYALFTLCFFSNLCGLVVTFYSLALTILFDQYKPNGTVFWISLIFYVPCLIWVKFICFPGKKAREHRRNVFWHRRMRNYFKRVRNNYYSGYVDDEDDNNDDIERQRGGRGGRDSSRKDSASNNRSYKLKKISFHGEPNMPSSRKASSIKLPASIGGSRSAKIEPNPEPPKPAPPPRAPPPDALVAGVLINGSSTGADVAAGMVRGQSSRSKKVNFAAANVKGSSAKGVTFNDNTMKLQSLKSKRLS